MAPLQCLIYKGLRTTLPEDSHPRETANHFSTQPLLSSHYVLAVCRPHRVRLPCCQGARSPGSTVISQGDRQMEFVVVGTEWGMMNPGGVSGQSHPHLHCALKHKGRCVEWLPDDETAFTKVWRKTVSADPQLFQEHSERLQLQ